MKNLFTAALLLPVSLWAQVVLVGTVKDAQTREPLPGANVIVPNLKLGTSTDRNGTFRMEFEETGMVGFKISYLGKEDLIESVRLKEGMNNYVFLMGQTETLLEEVTVSEVMADEKTPLTFTNIGEKEIEEVNYGQDLPFLLETTPSMVVTSDAGTGIGYTGLRLRGSDQTRISVSINGIPVNDAESHGVFWVNMPDLASSASKIQIQRGVGTSNHGTGAFGGSINISTFDHQNKPSASSVTSLGTFNTRRQTLEMNSGELKGGFSFNGRASTIKSDGFIDRATSDLNSYYFGGQWRGKKTSIRFTQFAGHERTYQSWYGVPVQFIEKDSARTFNPYTYENQVDDYGQTYRQLHFDHRFNSKWKLSFAGYQTLGAGYYESYKPDEDLGNFLNTDTLFLGDTITSGDFIIRRWLDNELLGGIFALDYEEEKYQITLGGGANNYVGAHFGEVIWAEYAGNSFHEDRYYENTAWKSDANVYVQTFFQPNKKLNLYLDLQSRWVNYRFIGNDNDGSPLTRTVPMSFFNPKGGVFYSLNANQEVYASVGVAHKEPNRNDFTDSSPNSQPKPEELIDFEAGYSRQGKRYTVQANLYYMHYNNQLILTGELNDVGAATRINVPESFRRGIEVQGGYQLTETVRLEGNLSLSQNKIEKLTVYYDDWDNGNLIEEELSNTDIAFSPSVIGAANLVFNPSENFKLTLQEKYVGKQYLDNTSSEERKLDPYAVTNFMAEYSNRNWIGKEVTLGLRAYNLLGSLYESNGWVYRFNSDGYNPIPDDPYVTGNPQEGNFQMIGLFPQAGTTFNLMLQVNF